MTKVVASADCGNSPKNQFAANLTIAWAKGDLGFILSHVVPEVQWTRVGVEVVEGSEKLAEALRRMAMDKAAVLTLKHVVTHGRAGAVDRSLTFKDGTTQVFCHVYEFCGAKATSVREITSYVIEATSPSRAVRRSRVS
jgi:hypothetical protein